jgi:hypothetical protein
MWVSVPVSDVPDRIAITYPPTDRVIFICEYLHQGSRPASASDNSKIHNGEIRMLACIRS